jgi:hypothetical protein
MDKNSQFGWQFIPLLRICYEAVSHTALAKSPLHAFSGTKFVLVVLVAGPCAMFNGNNTCISRTRARGRQGTREPCRASLFQGPLQVNMVAEERDGLATADYNTFRLRKADYAIERPPTWGGGRELKLRPPSPLGKRLVGGKLKKKRRKKKRKKEKEKEKKAW